MTSTCLAKVPDAIADQLFKILIALPLPALNLLDATDAEFCSSGSHQDQSVDVHAVPGQAGLISGDVPLLLVGAVTPEHVYRQIFRLGCAYAKPELLIKKLGDLAAPGGSLADNCRAVLNKHPDSSIEYKRMLTDLQALVIISNEVKAALAVAPVRPLEAERKFFGLMNQLQNQKVGDELEAQLLAHFDFNAGKGLLHVLAHYVVKHAPAEGLAAHTHFISELISALESMVPPQERKKSAEFLSEISPAASILRIENPQDTRLSKAMPSSWKCLPVVTCIPGAQRSLVNYFDFASMDDDRVMDAPSVAAPAVAHRDHVQRLNNGGRRGGMSPG